MAITIDEQGGMNTAPPTAQSPALDATKLGTRLAEYRILLRIDRRRRYLGLAAVGIGTLWLGLAALFFFNAGFPLALPLGLALSALMPALALLYEGIRQPTAVDTARTLDALLDNRQRVLTSVELLYGRRQTADGGREAEDAHVSRITYHERSELERAQLTSTARLLAVIEPRVLYPARVPVAQLAIAGGLLVLALGLWLLKTASDDFAMSAGGLPPGMDASGLVATPTADPGLPGTTEGAQADPGETDSGSEGVPLLPSTAGDGNGDGSGSSNGSSVSPEEAQQRATASREAEKSLQRLSRALDEQGVTQGIADSIRQGDYNSAGDALAQLGANNDQLSSDAKEALADSLDAAADESSGTPGLQDAERKAAEALRNGTYGEIKKALEELGEAVKDTGGQVVPQQDLAKDFPTQPSTNPTPQDGEDAGSSQDQQGQPGDSGQPGQPSQNQGGASVPGAGDNGQSPQPGDGSSSSAPSPGSPGGAPDSQGRGSGAGDPGLPGEGSRVDGPRGQELDAAGDPFALQGNENPDPNNLRPGDGSEPPAMTLEGDAGNSGAATSPSNGGPIDATGETSAPPMDRWGIVQRYFSPNER